MQAETSIARIRRHGRVLVIPTLVLLGVAFASGFFIGSLPELWQNLLAGFAAVLLVLLGVLLPFTVWLGNTTTLTTKRIIVRHGLLTRTRTEVPIARIREIRRRSSLGQRMFRAGDIELNIGDAEPFKLRDLPAVDSVVDVLHELVSATPLDLPNGTGGSATSAVGAPAAAAQPATGSVNATEAL